MELLLFGVRYTGGAESSPAWPATAMPVMHHWHIEFLPDVELLNMTGFRLPVSGFRRSSFWILTAFDQRQKKEYPVIVGNFHCYCFLSIDGAD